MYSGPYPESKCPEMSSATAQHKFEEGMSTEPPALSLTGHHKITYVSETRYH